MFGGDDDFREPLELDADEFIGTKSFRAKGKRISTFEVISIEELEPLRFPEVEVEEEVLESKKIEISAEDDDSYIEGQDSDNAVDDDEVKSQEDIRDEISGQMKLF